MKIEKIKLSKLRNEEWFKFFTEFKTFVTQSTPQSLNIEALFVAFLALHAHDESIEVLRKNSSTDEIVQLDVDRNNTFQRN
jgi:hypothetical protein